MESAFRTTVSALGICAACYLLSTASWQQVLLLFMVAGFAWCWFSAFGGQGSRTRSPHAVTAGDSQEFRSDAQDEEQAFGRLATEAPTPAPRALPPKSRRKARSADTAESENTTTSRTDRVQKIYRFPMHQLSRQGLTPVSE